jgi:pimeloyl-ACP methyl ester carboxylesterase
MGGCVAPAAFDYPSKGVPFSGSDSPRHVAGRYSQPPKCHPLGNGLAGRLDFRPLLARLKMPALVFEGAKTNVQLSSTREWARALPTARLLLIPDAGHELTRS